MSRFARHKDTAHRPTVIALRAAGASVQALDVKDGPDLMVGYFGATVLMEVKTVAVRTEKDGYQRTRRGQKSHGQASWHAEWKGGPLHTVYEPQDALLAIGLDVHRIAALRVITNNWTKDVSTTPQTRKQRPFRYGTDRARSLSESCKADFCTTSAVPGTKRCAAHVAEETFAPPVQIQGVDMGPPSRVVMTLGDRTVDVTGHTDEEMAEVEARLINEAAEEGSEAHARGER